MRKVCLVLAAVFLSAVSMNLSPAARAAQDSKLAIPAVNAARQKAQAAISVGDRLCLPPRTDKVTFALEISSHR